MRKKLNLKPEVIKGLIEASKFDATEIAKKTKISLRSLEKGMLSISQLKKLAKVLNRPIAAFFSDEIPPDVWGEFFDKVFDEIRDLFFKKNKVYGGDDDILKNIKQIALMVYGENTIETTYQVLTTLMGKHVNVILRKDAYKYEDIEERILDTILYCMLLLALLREK